MGIIKKLLAKQEEHTFRFMDTVRITKGDFEGEIGKVVKNFSVGVLVYSTVILDRGSQVIDVRHSHMEKF